MVVVDMADWVEEVGLGEKEAGCTHVRKLLLNFWSLAHRHYFVMFHSKERKVKSHVSLFRYVSDNDAFILTYHCT